MKTGNPRISSTIPVTAPTTTSSTTNYWLVTLNTWGGPRVL